MRKLAVTAVVTAALALVGAGSAAAPKVKGTVGPGFTITLKTLQGQVVRTLTPGAKSFVLSDKSTIHDFSLKGPGLSRHLTGVSFTGAKTVVVTLKRGTYTYYCSVHPTEMHRTFRVS